MSQQAPVDATFSIGSPSGTVTVRIIDTDRSQGKRSFDSVSIDLLELAGDGDVVTPTDPTTMSGSITTSTSGGGGGGDRC